jgi:serine/threonine-protein kinase
MTPSTAAHKSVIEFLRKRDYVFVRELGQGGCGRTVLLRDPQIDEYLVCKKYSPVSGTQRITLFENFVREIKLLYKLHHPNVVRMFNYYLYPDSYAGYLLMEYIQGSSIDGFLSRHPERINDVFHQVIGGFGYLQSCGILHRDIRPQNIMVAADGTAKIIDLGFGKEITRPEDFDKSVSLNWWCELPNEFGNRRYDYGTEVYFVGKLFERIIRDKAISCFEFPDTLREMCRPDPAQRLTGFDAVVKKVGTKQFFELEFSEAEREAYQNFADALSHHITKIEQKAAYAEDSAAVTTSLENAYRQFMLETFVPDSRLVLRCVVDGGYYYRQAGLRVDCVKAFLRLLQTCTEERRKIIFANLHTRLDCIARYSQADLLTDDDVPF